MEARQRRSGWRSKLGVVAVYFVLIVGVALVVLASGELRVTNDPNLDKLINSENVPLWQMFLGCIMSIFGLVQGAMMLFTPRRVQADEQRERIAKSLPDVLPLWRYRLGAPVITAMCLGAGSQ